MADQTDGFKKAVLPQEEREPVNEGATLGSKMGLKPKETVRPEIPGDGQHEGKPDRFKQWRGREKKF